MSYTVEPIDITKPEKVVDPRANKTKKNDSSPYKWWLADDDQTLVAQALSSVEYLKRTNTARIRQASIFTRLFCGKPLYNYLASNSNLDSSNQLPIGRPTANVVFSCIDTLTSRITIDKPKPVFLTDGGNYKSQKLAKLGNEYIQGEFFRTNTYRYGSLMFRDAGILGDGFLKVFARHGKVCVDRVLATELLVDFNDGYYDDPQQLFQLKLVDRGVLAQLFPKKEAQIENSVAGNVDSTPRSTETIADKVIVAEGWHLPSGPDAGDGRHIIVCSDGVLLDEEWDKDRFPFVKFSYNPNVVGFFSQGLAEILMPCQMEIYRMLILASQSLELMGVPRIYMDQLSEIMETSFNNRIGTIIKGRGPTPPTFINATSNAPEIYQWIQWLIQNSYDMSGISRLAAQGEKPAGLNSGEAIREYDGTQESRFGALATRYQNVFPDLAYLMVDTAADIEAEGKGKYSTRYVGKDGTKEIDFKKIEKLKDDAVIQCFEESSLPKDPAGRQAKLSEMLAAGEINQQEFRRLSNLPDLEQSDRLAAALEERILKTLDDIVENGEKNAQENVPDPFMLDPTDLATTLCVNYINRYATLELEEEKLQALRDWFTQVQTLKAAAMPPPVQSAPAPQTQGNLPPPAPPQAPTAPTSGVAV